MATEINKYPAKNKKYKETIVFVHHFGGNARSYLRHIQFVNELGFDAVSFSLSYNSDDFPKEVPWDSNFEIGYVHIWKEEIESVLNQLSGPKVLFGFSNPSGAMLLAAARRNYVDISAVICDGGPFLNTLKMMLPVITAPKRQFTWKTKVGIIFLNRMLFGKNYNQQAKSALESVPSRVPFLSIRSWRDKLVPSSNIDEYFSMNPKIDLEVLSLTEADHLQGLKTHPDEYKSRVGDFLIRVSSSASQ